MSAHIEWCPDPWLPWKSEAAFLEGCREAAGRGRKPAGTLYTYVCNSWESVKNGTFVPIKWVCCRAHVRKWALVMTSCLMQMAESRCVCTPAQQSMRTSNLREVHASRVSWLLLPSCSWLLYVLWHCHFALQVQVDEWCKENDSQTFCVFIFFIGPRVTGNLIERPPPPGGVSCLLCSLIKNRV